MAAGSVTSPGQMQPTKRLSPLAKCQALAALPCSGKAANAEAVAMGTRAANDNNIKTG